MFLNDGRRLKVADHYMDFWVLCGDWSRLCRSTGDDCDIEVGVFDSQLLDDGASDIASCSETVVIRLEFLSPSSREANLHEYFGHCEIDIAGSG